jgi:16S rRNA (cytosine1402-N4)-methyltransferase
LTPADIPIAKTIAAHKRRSRYKGTHPREFGDKYKELGADPDAMAKAKARGSTPAGAHLPVMLKEILEALAPLPGATILDCTLGWGGHTLELARRGAKVIGLDRDGEELERTRERLRSAGADIVARQSNYAEARLVLSELRINGVDGLLADLGVSSMQLDRPERGMSFKNDGPLDMRMDRSKGKTAAEWLADASEPEIAAALERYGNEPDAKKIAAELFGRALKSTADLAEAVAVAKGLGGGKFRKKDAFAAHPATRVFQALRIIVNSEHEALAQLLRDLPLLVKPGGRVALLTFHSGEEALVAEALRAQTGMWLSVPGAPLKASPEEVRENPRARSARLWRVVRA